MRIDRIKGDCSALKEVSGIKCCFVLQPKAEKKGFAASWVK